MSPCEAVEKFGVDRVSPGTVAECEKSLGRKIPGRPAGQPASAEDVAAYLAAMAVPRKKWPLRVRAVAKLAKPEDRGIGDTVARMAGAVGGETLASWYTKLTGKDCGCADRQGRLNAMYPYRAETA